tara:strand:+ start:399 stop:533 length:135 start_codon:yes stop_codon:yes gene_type:complete
MKTIYTIEKNFSKKKRRISLIKPSRLLADYFNGEIIEFDEKYIL